MSVIPPFDAFTPVGAFSQKVETQGDLPAAPL